MVSVRFIYSFVLFLSLICAIGLIRYSFKRRTMPGAKYFIATTLFIMVYNGAYIGELNSSKLSIAMVWFNIEYISISILPYLWIMMCLDYIGTSIKYMRIAKYVMLYHPLSVAIIFFTNNIHHLYISSYSFKSNGYFEVIIAEKGILYTVVIGAITLIGLMCTVIYLIGYMKAIPVHRFGYIIMIVASLFPWLSIYLNTTDLDFPYLGIDYFPVITIVTGIIYMYGIFQYRIFNVIPIAKEMVFRQSKEAILLADSTDTILDANDAFLRIYPEVKELLKNETVTSFIKSHEEFKLDFNVKDKFQYELVIEGAEIHYSAELIKIFTEDGVEIGKMLQLNDITLFVENQRKLQSIASEAIDKAEINEISFLQAQIKPHFINNTLSVISSMITRDSDAAKKLLVNLSEYLVNCYSYDNISAVTTLEEELEIVNTYVNIEKARFRERLNFQLIYENIVKVDIPRLVLQTLIENSIQHGILKKIKGGTISLKINYDLHKAYFEISDDGVGIVEERIESLLKGLDDKQGVGIFNANKRLMKYCGEGLKIDSAVGKGTRVSFSIPLKSN